MSVMYAAVVEVRVCSARSVSTGHVIAMGVCCKSSVYTTTTNWCMYGFLFVLAVLLLNNCCFQEKCTKMVL